MIIYGWNSKRIKETLIDFYKCPDCLHEQSTLTIMAQYVHLFWIPLFPIGKSAQIVCSGCKRITNEEEILPDKRLLIERLKSTVVVPKYLFLGVTLIALSIVYFSYNSLMIDARNRSLIEVPETGDVYVLKDLQESGINDHYLMKVHAVRGDSLWVSLSSYYYSGVVSALDPNDGFFDETYLISKSEIKEMYEMGEVRKVIRDYVPSAGFDRVKEFKMDTSRIDGF